MRANPGGQLSPDQVVGRDRLITNLWRILDRQSLVLSAERRLGKTSILRKMEAEPHEDWLPIFRDLERVHSPIEFVETVVQDARTYLGKFKRTAQRISDALTALGGTEIGGILKLPPQAAPQWKMLLTRTIEDLFDEKNERRFVFFWDEVPLMLGNIKRSAGETVAMEMLDVLRSLRQSNRQIRMVFTGSIGLHNVLTSLKRAGYANDPTNDMDTVDVPALVEVDAVNLAADLLRGERLRAADLDATASTIARQVDCLPYFIHHVVDQLAKRGDEATPALATSIIDQCLTAPQDPWHLRYYHERIDTYYLADERPLALTILDALAVAETPVSLDDLMSSASATLGTIGKEQLRSVMTLVQRDHYVVQEATGSYRFRFPLIQRHWRSIVNGRDGHSGLLPREVEPPSARDDRGDVHPAGGMALSFGLAYPVGRHLY